MRLPKRIQVGPFVYRVREKKRLVSDDQERLYGQARHSDLEIRLDKDLHADNKRETLLHEVLHAVANERNLDLTEGCVHQMSHGLAAVFIDNPDLTRLFLAENGGER